MDRQIALDTETTGMPVEDGHKVIEIGAVEMIDRCPTGRTYHVYLNPERDIDAGAQSVHGLSRDFLSDKPLFSEIVDDFLSFIQDSELLIHNAPFDVGFLNAELKQMGRVVLEALDLTITDTLVLAKKRRPRKRNSLDQLCKDYGIGLESRQFHGALLDAQLLQQAYLALTAEQANLFVDVAVEKNTVQHKAADKLEVRGCHVVSLEVPVCLSEKHHSYLDWMVESHGQCMWRKLESDKS